MGLMEQKRPTGIKGTVNHAKTLFSKKIFSGAITSVVQSLAPLRYSETVNFRQPPIQRSLGTTPPEMICHILGARCPPKRATI
jgi:hypothetical protein